MKLDRDTEKDIKNFFDAMKSIDDLLSLMNFVNNKLYIKSQPLKRQQLLYHAYINTKKYSNFEIGKKSGGKRIIYAPNKGLKHILRTLNIILQCIYKPQMPAHGFVQKKSIVTNAKYHVEKNYVYNIDLEDFFPSIHQARVWKRIQMPPFNLNGSRQEIANLIASLTCYQHNIKDFTSAEPNLLLQENGKVDDIKSNFLPQGSPTSPTISNIVCDRLDKKLYELARRFNAKYTRYADDITFSSMHNIYQNDSEFLAELQKIILDQNFKINTKKTRLQKRGYKQEVTGIIVNDKTNVRRQYIKQLRAMLYSLEEYGIDKAEDYFSKKYIMEKKHIKVKSPSMLKTVFGKLNYLKMVKGETDDTYLKLKNRFEVFLFKEKKDNRIVLDQELEKSVYTTLFTSTVADSNSENSCLKFRKCFEEFKNDNTHTIFEWIKKILQYFLGSIENGIKQDASISKNCIKHNPKKLSKVLTSFTLEEPWKSATHPGLLNKDYEVFMTTTAKKWQDLISDSRDVLHRLEAKIFNFLLRPNIGKIDNNGKYIEWGSNHIRFGWSSPELREWCQREKDKTPFEFPLPPNRIQSFGNVSTDTFSDIINAFKMEIEFRPDSNNLYDVLLKLCHDILKNNFKVEVSEKLRRAKFFTNVEWVNKGLKSILFSIQGHSKNKKVQIDIIDYDEYVELLINDVGSKSIMPPEKIKERIDSNKGSFSSIIYDFCSVCDFSIESNYQGKNFRLEMLSEDQSIKIKYLDIEVKGFLYIMRFYK